MLICCKNPPEHYNKDKYAAVMVECEGEFRWQGCSSDPCHEVKQGICIPGVVVLREILHHPGIRGLTVCDELATSLDARPV